jgi:Predicted membrane protein
MAGIGFELKKLFAKKGLFAKMRAYTYAGIVCAGPMILGLLLLIGLQIMLDVLDKDGKVLSRQSLDVKLSQITNSAVVTVFAEVQLHGLLNEAAGRGIAIEIDDPSTMRAAVHMDMENAQDSMIYPLYEE